MPIIRGKHVTLEGPIGGLIGAGLGYAASGGSLVGSLVGGLVGQTLLGDYGQQQPSYQQAAVPAQQPTPTMPETPGLPSSSPSTPNMGQGDAPPLTPEEIARGRADEDRKRRGRLSTILTSRRQDEDVERLGG